VIRTGLSVSGSCAVLDPMLFWPCSSPVTLHCSAHFDLDGWSTELQSPPCSQCL